VTGQDRAGGLRTALVAVIAVALLLLGGGLAVVLGVGREAGTAVPAADSVAVGFSRDMATHHLQGVEMANLALQRTEDAEVRQLAFDISATQTNQVGRMQGWLSLWGVPPTGGDVMAWMADGGGGTGDGMDSGHAMGSGHAMAGEAGALMPGMATEAELDELRSLSGDDFDRQFLRLMIRHHQGGLEMAQHTAEQAEVPAVARLAETIAATQSAETGTMTDMLAARGGSPLPAP
jgi:uncharacterized protein (DUF305 family)